MRISFFLGGILIFYFWERFHSFRQTAPDKRKLNHLALTFFNSLVVKILAPLSLGILAYENNQSSWSPIHLNQYSLFFSLPISLLILDFTIYWQHRLFHSVDLLWRLHRVHHSDRFFDFTTALRFHTLEILLSFLIKAIIVIVLGIPLEGILLFEVLLNFSAMFNHSNANVPEPLENFLSKIIVTPSFHRVHHSTHPLEHNSNFGFCLSLWDYLFSSHKFLDNEKQREMEIGLSDRKGESTILALLIDPFKR